MNRLPPGHTSRSWLSSALTRSKSSPYPLPRGSPMFSATLFAQRIDSSTTWLGIMAAFAAVIFFSFAMLLFNRYKRCPSNRVLVFYGKVGGGNTARCIHGGAAFVMPLVQDFAYLN